MGRSRRRSRFVVAAPAGVRIRTRLHPTPDEARVLTEIGEFNGRFYRRELAGRIALGNLDRKGQAEFRAARKRALTAQTSSRWAGAITRSVQDQYQCGMRALVAQAKDLDAAVAAVAARCALAPGERNGRVTGYRDGAERFQKTRRLEILRDRAERVHHRWDSGRPSIVMGGKRWWRTRNHLTEGGLTEHRWRQQWNAARMFLTADGETGKSGGNETLRVIPGTGQLRIKVPAGLADRFGIHLAITTPVEFHHRGQQWRDRVQANRAVRYDISYDPTRCRWYLDTSWTLEPTLQIPLTALRAGRVLGVDLNDGHLTTSLLDASGTLGPNQSTCGREMTYRPFRRPAKLPGTQRM